VARHLLGAANGYLSYSQMLRNLVRLWQSVGQAEQVDDLVFEYIQRGLLNKILGN
jgi:serine/threonine-protein kinase HipA